MKELHSKTSENSLPPKLPTYLAHSTDKKIQEALEGIQQFIGGMQQFTEAVQRVASEMVLTIGPLVRWMEANSVRVDEQTKAAADRLQGAAFELSELDTGWTK